jgi:hypothetical protein
LTIVPHMDIMSVSVFGFIKTTQHTKYSPIPRKRHQENECDLSFPS